jgi:hypothetical protein
MNTSQWTFILAGIVGVLVLAWIGALRIHWSRRDQEVLEAEETSWPDEGTGVGRKEIRAFVRTDRVEPVVQRLVSEGAADVDVTPLDAIRRVGRPPGDAPHIGLSKIEMVCDGEEKAWELADTLREEGAEVVGQVWISSVEDVMGPLSP